MSLNGQLWEKLQARGLREAHLELLLTTLELQRNGHLSWHFVHGRLEQVDLRLILPNTRCDLGRVTEVLTGAESRQES